MFVLGACSPLLELVGVNSVTSENTPFFMDDFSDHQNGWKLTIQEEGIVQYDGDAIRMLIKKPGNRVVVHTRYCYKRFIDKCGCRKNKWTG